MTYMVAYQWIEDPFDRHVYKQTFPTREAAEYFAEQMTVNGCHAEVYEIGA